MVLEKKEGMLYEKGNNRKKSDKNLEAKSLQNKEKEARRAFSGCSNSFSPKAGRISK